jgi:hypothetical protein
MACTQAMLAPGESTYFGNLEFIAASSGELRLVPSIAPVQAIHFGSPNIITDRFSILHLSDEGSDVGRRYELLPDATFVGVAAYVCFPRSMTSWKGRARTPLAPKLK